MWVVRYAVQQILSGICLNLSNTKQEKGDTNLTNFRWEDWSRWSDEMRNVEMLCWEGTQNLFYGFIEPNKYVWSLKKEKKLTRCERWLAAPSPPSRYQHAHRFNVFLHPFLSLTWYQQVVWRPSFYRNRKLWSLCCDWGTRLGILSIALLAGRKGKCREA